MFDVRKVLVVMCIFGLSLSVSAEVINFDDIAGNASNYSATQDQGNGLLAYQIANGYAGLTWNNMWILDGTDYNTVLGVQSGYGVAAMSGKDIALNFYGNQAITASSGSTFDFNGAFFTSAWYDNNILTLTGLNNGTVVGTVTVGINTTGPQWVNCDFLGVDEVDFSTTNYQFAMDNMTINKSAVPEPGILSLVAVGLLSLGCVIRRKKS
jgi:hypothetical protein